MENNIVNQVKSFFNEEVLQRLSHTLGEPKEKLNEGINAVIPSVLLGLQSQSGTQLSGILEQAKQHFSNFDFSDWIQKNSGEGSPHLVQDIDDKEAVNTDLLRTIFGNNYDNLLQILTQNVGLKSNSVKKILSVSLPAVFASLSKHGGNWTSSSISALLEEQKEGIKHNLPTSLGLAAFGTSFAALDTSLDPAFVDPVNPDEDKTNPILESAEPAPVPLMTSETIPPPALPAAADVVDPILPPPPPPHTPIVDPGHFQPAAEEKKSGSKLWVLVLILALLGIVWFLFGKSCAKESTSPLVDTVAQVQPVGSEMQPQAEPVQRESLVVTLPSGKTINAYKNGIEDQLVTFLKSDYKSLGEEALKNKWFDFDNLNFELGTAQVTAESQTQLANIAAILQEFPEAKIKIGGYTDKTGDEKLNKKLSEDRAEAVEDYLKSKNLGSQVDGAEGYGSEFAKYPASASESERILDRHVSVSVR